MYKCGICGKQTESGMRSYKIVTEKRDKEYRTYDGRTIKGWEIVKEVLTCEKCRFGVINEEKTAKGDTI